MFIERKNRKRVGLTGRAERLSPPSLDRLWVPRADNLPETVPPPPLTWWPLGNMKVGDCVEAATAHAIQATRYTLDSEVVNFTASEVVDTYNLYRRQQDGGKDLGTLPEVFETWVEKGVWGWKAEYVTVTTDEETLKATLNEYGNVLLEVVLYNDDCTAFEYLRPWMLSKNPGAVYGLHEVALVGYDRAWFYAVTWGVCIRVSPRWIAARTQLATAMKNVIPL